MLRSGRSGLSDEWLQLKAPKRWRASSSPGGVVTTSTPSCPLSQLLICTFLRRRTAGFRNRTRPPLTWKRAGETSRGQERPPSRARRTHPQLLVYQSFSSPSGRDPPQSSTRAEPVINHRCLENCLRRSIGEHLVWSTRPSPPSPGRRVLWPILATRAKLTGGW